MDPVENSRAAAQEVVALAQKHGVDLSCSDGHFQTSGRWIYLWRKDLAPGTGPADEPLGTLHYNMQGRVARLPCAASESSSAFKGSWSEAGTLESVEQAYELVKRWLLDRSEVDELPARQVRRWMIG